MTRFALDNNGRFVIRGYRELRPFASFLPGIAGRMGIPMWAFYVNRGQGVVSFGVESKDCPVMEFLPANKAYQSVAFTGFRTFLRARRGERTAFLEPFAPWSEAPADNQSMTIGANDLEIEETSAEHGISTKVRYFLLPDDRFAGMVREVTIRNVGTTPVSLEILDGMPAVIPYGVSDALLKELGRTVEAWMEVFHSKERAPFYRLRASVVDAAEVETFEAGHFALAFVDDGRLLPCVVDPAVVFAHDLSLHRPEGFCRQPLAALLEVPQITCGRTPCAFFAHEATLAPGTSVTLRSIVGHVACIEILEQMVDRISRAAYVDQKAREAADLVTNLTDIVATRTAFPLFDAYCRQSFLDNVLRGGWPVLIGGRVVHIYARKHGDLERDYNAFFVAPEPYSQGELSYRDVNQNRRDDVRLEPRVGDFDIRTFMSLIQTDGYNPRSVRGNSFTLAPAQAAAVAALAVEPEKLRAVLSKPFTPGKLLSSVTNNDIKLRVSPDELLVAALSSAEQRIEAAFHEGFWIDHFEYNLDLIESHLSVYPDRQDDLLFGRADLPFFDSPVFVQPRSKKYVLDQGAPRQIGSVVPDAEKAARIAARPDPSAWSRTEAGEIYRVTLFVKLALTTMLKFATLDPAGMGIEMEAGRPGWYDALNGLPALFGSGMSETFELCRWLGFLRDAIQAHGSGDARIPVEAADLLDQVSRHLSAYEASTAPARDLHYWDAVSSARENYRERTRFGFKGNEKSIPLADLDRAFEAFEKKVRAGIARATDLGGGIPPTYFSFGVPEYELLGEKDEVGRAFIGPRSFTPKPLPLFLEGPVHAFKVLPNAAAARDLYRAVKGSALFDSKLGMYKVNASLASLPHDVGRARAFPPGWLENESIWLHMEYKYLLEVLEAGLFDEFFSDLKTTLVPFLDPETYGRSTLENSSFLASSAHADPSLHGGGFVARLSGSTAELLSLWTVMMAGKQPFELRSGRLCLSLKPALPAWLFTKEGELSFRFLGSCTVTYKNPQRLDTWTASPKRAVLHLGGGKTVEIDGPAIPMPYAEQVRDGAVTAIDVWF
jgi:hypothetical protein